MKNKLLNQLIKGEIYNNIYENFGGCQMELMEELLLNCSDKITKSLTMNEGKLFVCTARSKQIELMVLFFSKCD